MYNFWYIRICRHTKLRWWRQVEYFHVLCARSRWQAEISHSISSISRCTRMEILFATDAPLICLICLSIGLMRARVEVATTPFNLECGNSFLRVGMTWQSVYVISRPCITRCVPKVIINTFCSNLILTVGLRDVMRTCANLFIPFKMNLVYLQTLCAYVYCCCELN